MGTMSPKQEREMMAGCFGIVVGAAIILGLMGYGAWSLITEVLN